MTLTMIPDPNLPEQSQEFKLPDGRTLGFAEYGMPTGISAFFMHGYFGSRLDGSEWHQVAADKGVRIICIDRPGYGLSSFQPGRRILDLPQDIQQLARHLGYETFYVFGQSGGGPYALACAYALPEACRAAVDIAGIGPWKECGTRGTQLGSKIFFWMLAYTPWLVRLLSIMFRAKQIYTADQVKLEEDLTSAMKRLQPKDREIMTDPVVIKTVVATLRETFRQGDAAAIQDGRLYTSDWGFKPEDIRKKVLFFHGDEDVNAPLSHSKHLVERIPYADLTVFHGDTHFTILPRYAEMMDRMLRENAI